ncbi:bacteriocin-associated integral membrane family protein [Nocardiopsis eucommiae]|uniref:bacteriocin-associated integral membrane family protein n=1 Tax=Nocardiopsis eucommiae TaxID=2831970 RepID=UPI003D71944B
MPNRTLAFAYAACAVFATLIAFLLAGTSERTTYVLEDSRLVWITQNEGGHDNDEVAASVQQVADEHDTAIGFAVLDVNQPASLGHLYLAVPGPDSRQAGWLADGYPSFGRGFSVETHPVADFGEVGPNGTYLVFGSEAAESALRSALSEHGLHEAPGTQTTQAWHYFSGGFLFHLLLVAVLGSVTAAGAGVLLGAREYAVMRLQGRSYLRILGGDLLRVTRWAGVVLPAVSLVTLVFLGFYNGWNQLGYFTTTALVFLAMLAIPCLLVHAAFLGVVHLTGILPSLRGRLPVRTTIAAVYLVRVPVLVLTLVILGGIVTQSQNARDTETALGLYEDQGETSFLGLSADYGWDDPQAVDDQLGPWLRDTDADGDLVLAVHSHRLDLDRADVENGTANRLEQPLLVVNDTYLEEQEVRAPDGDRYGPGEGIRVLVPEGLTVDTEVLVEAVRATWIDPSDAPDRGPDVRVSPTANDQSLFVYASKRFDEPRPHLPLLHDPVVVVLPNAGVLADSTYVSLMSQNQLYFPDPTVVDDYRARDPDASRYLAMVETLTTSALAEQAGTLTTLRTELFNLAGAAAVLVLTAMAACVVHVRTRAQEIFARHISGWTFAATHRRLLLVEGALALAFLGWANWDTLRRTALLDDPLYGGPPDLAPSGAEPLHALGIVLACLVITVAALALFHRRIVREGASQA